jgi:hypothetical protein
MAFIMNRLHLSVDQFQSRFRRFRSLWYWNQLLQLADPEDINRSLPLPQEQYATTFHFFDKPMPKPHPLSPAANPAYKSFHIDGK